MGVIEYGKVVIHGNFERPRRYKNGKPKNWIDRDWKAIIPYPFKWRVRWCGVECDCKEVIESYQPYYGSNWSHMDDCAIMKHHKAHPGYSNVAGYPPPPAVQAED